MSRWVDGMAYDEEPKKEPEQLDFLDELDEMDTDYEVQVYDGEEDEGCEGGACKI